MVEIITSTTEMSSIRSQLQGKVGFVPTMGNLHQGHMSLLKKALEENTVVIISIFVNPTQFGPQEDFSTYPRTPEHDLELIRGLAQENQSRKVLLFMPASVEDIYPPNDTTKISVESLNSTVEGVFRPGHFDGVSTVVWRLFKIVKPHQAYFGLKDYQQYLVIKKMARDLNLNIEIIGMPTIRDASGIALSSRNQYLSPEQKQEALKLPTSLQRVATALVEGEIEQAQKLRAEILEDSRWNYLEIRDAQTLSKNFKAPCQVVILGVFQLGKTRLLDNLLVNIA